MVCAHVLSILASASRRHLPFLAVPLAAVPVLVASAADIASVSQHGRVFSIQSLQISRNQIVRFVNEDPFVHNIFVDSATFRYESGLQPPGTSREITFSQIGSFVVLCAIHPQMELHVDVR